MKLRIINGVAVAAAIAIALAGCTGTGGDGGFLPDYGAPAETETETEAPDAGATGGSALMTADSSLGEIVVDGAGLTVYLVTLDTQGAGTSSCEGTCATNWPAVTVESGAPTVEGVTGEVGTITGVDGETQVTLNGWPLYYYVGDDEPGDTNGQGLNDVGWVLSPAGEQIGG